MKTIYNEIDELLEKYGGQVLSNEETAVYKRYKKSVWIEYFLYTFAYRGIARIYLGDRFSKIYGVILFVLQLLKATIVCKTSFYAGTLGISLFFLYNFQKYLSLALDISIIVDFFFVYHVVIRNNLLLKKQIIEDKIPVKRIISQNCWLVITVILLTARAIQDISINWYRFVMAS